MQTLTDSSKRAIACAIASLCLLLTTAIPAAVVLGQQKANMVSAEEAIRTARNEASEMTFFMPEELDRFKMKAGKRTLAERTYWVVTFIDEVGKERDRYVIDSQTGELVRSKAVLMELGGWQAFLYREGFLADWTWAFIGLAASAMAGYAGYRWSIKERTGWLGWLVNGARVVMIGLFAFGIVLSLAIADTRGAVIAAICTVLIAAGPVIARRQRGAGLAEAVAPEVSAVLPVPLPSTDQPLNAAATPAPVPVGPSGPRGRSEVNEELHVTSPDRLPCFADIGGMEEVKQQLRESVGLLLSHGDLAKRYRIDWNGILMYGPPGVGKTFLAKAAAGEFGLNFIDIRVSDLISSFTGESSKRIANVFKQAANHRPCILFFDEFDSVAQRREDRSWDTESTRVVNQLLRELESAREIPDLVVMAATNHKRTLDEAVIRPGRFDRHIAIGMPDGEARRKIFAVQLSGRPVLDDLDLDELVHRTDGMSAADIAAIVNTAALDALRESVAEGRTAAGTEEVIGQDLLLAALETLRAKVSPTITPMRWDDLVLDAETKARLQEFQMQIERSEELTMQGLEPPSGLLLYGPPGTGKTTIARVLATEANASFFSLDASEVKSMWLGETEQNIARIFDEARRHRPAIIFIDEIESLIKKRGDGSTWDDDHTTQFLREIDGVDSTSGVFVVGATNMPDALDPALTRGGRLSMQIRIPLPDEAGRAQLFEVHARKMRIAEDVEWHRLAELAGRMSGADIKEVVSAAGLLAFADDEPAAMRHFLDAMRKYRAGRRTSTEQTFVNAEERSARPFGFAPDKRGPADRNSADSSGKGS